MTLIELALVLSLTGALLAAFLPTFLRQLSTSKLTEAVERLDALHRHAASYYARDRGALHGCLPDSAGPFPLAPSADPVDVDFALDQQGAPSWRALAQQPAKLRYSYQLEVPEAGCGQRGAGPALRLRAFGDLDGDGTTSMLERASRIERGELVPQGPLRIVSRTE
jgi:type II secretory pathway pseudopilin PulG